MKWNESGFRPPLCTYRLNWTRRTSGGWWDEWDDISLDTQDSIIEPWWSEAEWASSRSRRLPTILMNHYEWAGKKLFVSLKIEGQSGVQTRDLLLSKEATLTTAPAPTSINLANEDAIMIIGNVGWSIFTFYAAFPMMSMINTDNLVKMFNVSLYYYLNQASSRKHKIFV